MRDGRILRFAEAGADSANCNFGFLLPHGRARQGAGRIEPAERMNGQPPMGKAGPHSASDDKAASTSPSRGSGSSNEAFELAITGRRISNKLHESEDMGRTGAPNRQDLGRI